MKLKNLTLAVVLVVSITILTTYIGCGKPSKKDDQEKTKVAGIIRVKISVNDSNTARLWDNYSIKKLPIMILLFQKEKIHQIVIQEIPQILRKLRIGRQFLKN